MKKVLVLVVLFALITGVMPASAEAEINPEIPDFEGRFIELLWTSKNVEIGLLSVNPETHQARLFLCIYADYGGWADLSPCLSFTITDKTEIYIDWKKGPGDLDDLETGQTAAVEYYHKEGMVYARRILVTDNLWTASGRITDIDRDNRIISWCTKTIVGGCWHRNPLYVPNHALITFHWDDNLHDLDEVLVKDYFRVVIYEHDDIPFYKGPIIHVRYRPSFEQPIDTGSESFYIYAPIVISKK